MAEEQYRIHNTSRFSRTLGGGDRKVRRDSPVTVSASKLQQFMGAILADDSLEVRDMSGKLLDAKALAAGVVTLSAERPNTPAKQSPNFRPDSAANDPTFPGGVGNPVPTMQGGKGEGEHVDAPSTGLPGMGEEKPIESGGDPVVARKKDRSKSFRKSDDE